MSDRLQTLAALERELTSDAARLAAVSADGSWSSSGSDRESEACSRPGDALESADPIDLDDAGTALTRYRVGPELGTGGMGQVSLVEDRRLLRDVAWKTGDARLLREARILAQLEHPGIVPIHDMGLAPDGRLFLAMRVVRGRSLAQILHQRPTEEARRELLRPLLQVAQAVAYAHHRGVVHRDLKPANIMIGPFGESQVVDWGLARVLDDAVAPVSASVRAAVDAPPAGRIGTPGYMSPEQQRGEAADRRADVFGLGRVLAAILEQPAHTNAPPPELRAILERATQADPADRYLDAAAFAEDLERYLDGRRVSAHAYRPKELLRRFVRAYRIPLVIAAVAFVTVAVLVAVYVADVATQRTIAEHAEDEARAALRTADRNLARALVGDARRLLESGARPEAEVLAAHALLRGEDPEARGVLAAFASAPAPVLINGVPSPCPEPVLDATARHALCIAPDGIAVWDVAVAKGEPGSGGRRRWSLRGPVRVAAFLEDTVVAADGRFVTLYAVADGRRLATLESACDLSRRVAISGHVAVLEAAVCSVVADARARSLAIILPCDGDYVAAVAWRASDGLGPDTQPLVTAVCANGSLVTGQRRYATAFGSPDHEVVRLVPLDGGGWVVGTNKGEVAVLDRGGQLLRSQYLVDGMVRVLETSPDGRLLAVAGERESIVLAALPDLGRVAALPRRARTFVWHAATDGGDARFTSGGEQIETWQLAPGDAYASGFETGVTSIDVADPGSRIAVGHGAFVSLMEGTAARRDMDTGTHLVKDVTFLDERGGSLAVAAIQATFQLDMAARAIVLELPLTARRIGRLADHTLVVAAYEGTFLVLDGVMVPHLDEPALDLAEGAGHLYVALLRDEDRALVRIGAGAPLNLEVLGYDPLATAIAISADGRRIYAARNGAIAVWSDAGTVERVYRATGASLLELAIAPDETWIAAGTRDGEVWIFAADELSPRAIFRDHSERVSALAFASGPARLLSGGWDRVVRVRDLATLAEPAEALLARVSERYRLTLSEALGASSRAH